MRDVRVDVEVRPVLQAVGHRPIGAFFEPLAQIGGHRDGFARTVDADALEHGDMIRQEAMSPRVPLGVGNTRPSVGRDVEVVFLGPARRGQVGVAYATVTPDRYG